MALIALALFLLLPSRARALSAAAGKIDVTPDLRREKTWLAGFGATGRRAQGVHDPTFARAVVVSDGRKTVALVGVDCIGLFREDVERIRRELGWQGGDRYVFVSATHVHSGPDTLGLWGPWPGVSGVDERYHRRLISLIVELVRRLATELKPAELRYARTDLDPRGLCKDSRDPVVIDPELDAVQLRRSGGGAIGTIVRWSCHPETSWDDNKLLTADYPGQLCARVEERAGGACLFQNGVIGGLLTPDTDHVHGVDKEFAEGRRVGQAVADSALQALARGRTVEGARVSFASRLVRLEIESSRYVLFLPSLAFGHVLRDAGGRPLPRWRRWWLPVRHLLAFPLPERLRPWIETEAARVDVGPVAFVGLPGEFFPELALGGYDGRYRFGHPLIQPDNPNPPNLARAPRGPYLRQLARAPLSVLVGLANDELGYVIPAYDFKAAGTRSMTPQPPGDHYEETNSIGVGATDRLVGAVAQLLRR